LFQLKKKLIANFVPFSGRNLHHSYFLHTFSRNIRGSELTLIKVHFPPDI